MSQIDWSKAPEGATHWDLGINNRVAGWMRLDANVWYWWPVDEAHSCPKKWHASLNQHMVDSEGFVERPEVWNGEGVPPAGTVCERRFPEVGGSSWRQITILFIGEQKVFYRDEAGDEWANLPDDVEFRPIRTAEQIAEEKRTQEICEIRELLESEPLNPTLLAYAIHAAGYRKEPTQ